MWYTSRHSLSRQFSGEQKNGMNSLNLTEVNTFVNERINSLLQKQYQSLVGLCLEKLLRRSPLLFLERNPNASEVIEHSLNTYLAVTREHLFKHLLVELAQFIVMQEGNGRSSAISGIDLELTHNNTPHFIIIHPWLIEPDNLSFNPQPAAEIQPTIGVSYGKAFTGYLHGYLHFIGPHFWRIISYNKNLYDDLITPIRYRIGTYDDAFHKEKSAIINRLTLEFINRFCQHSGEIDWTRIIERDIDPVNDYSTITAPYFEKTERIR